MRIHGNLKINGKSHSGGDEVSWLDIYPFFLMHVGIFGAVAFGLAYLPEKTSVVELYIYGVFSISIYLIFYVTIFGVEEVKWMIVNSILGFYGIYVELDILLSQIGKAIIDYPIYVHFVPFFFYIMYTFLIRQTLLDVFKARDNRSRTTVINNLYVTLSLILYTYLSLQ